MESVDCNSSTFSFKKVNLKTASLMALEELFLKTKNTTSDFSKIKSFMDMENFTLMMVQLKKDNGEITSLFRLSLHELF